MQQIFNNRMNFSLATLPIMTLVNQIKNERRNGLDLQPTYQRGYIWETDFKEKLIYSLTKHYPIGNIIIRNLEIPNEKNAKTETVDGQQRLTTIYNFIIGEFDINGDITRKIIAENIDYFEEEESTNKNVAKILKKYKENKKIVLKFTELPVRLQDDINTFPLSLTYISNATTEQVSEYFRFVQNQERLKAGEIIESFPDTILEKYLNALNNKEKFLSILNFEDNRKEFEKIFYSMIGIFDKKIPLGCADKKIKEYVYSKESELDGECLKFIKNLIKNINHISKLKDDLNINSNKRLLKLLLLLCAFNILDFENDSKQILLKLNEINIKLSAFNSAKKNVIKEVFKDLPDEVIEDYRGISLLVKGSQKFIDVEEQIKTLKKLLS